MSYILEALKRADVERKRGQDSNIRAMVVAGDHASKSEFLPAWRWVRIAMGVLLVLVGWGLSALLSRPSMVSSSITSPPLVQGAAVGVMRSGLAVHEVVSHSETLAPLRRADHLEQAVKQAQSASPIEVVAQPSSALQAEALPHKLAPELKKKALHPVKQEAVPLMRLPAPVRAQLPPLEISALIDHADPARRVAMINGRALHIGQYINAAVQLVDIHQQSVELMFQGYRLLMTPFDNWPPR
ncbi:MAG: general secretion pathway protein GspB [Mariprofundales bacterium]